ncbi:coproporphyrinogen III oxidase [bacterium BMS3Abin07]|nr:coproporphyrinogen III oxidase [bacterium BMS3Abin07]GBE31120.1 coproporphyrinogen III oxidase [bacterium BMS3Bbin05]HDL20982.1 TIGR01212 family radical SAM protein [Nitrospirota bacterium]HDO22125.1 TIGR01212 family radical SAM protein [Nitrospirota bacterium]HDZ88320.1 TIGR01212 family radical SAM protein [Nitrospirota bacterium]
MSDRYNAFGAYLKKRFGERVYKVNIDAGFTCPNRDGTVGYGGCVYCNNDSFRPSSCSSVIPVSEQVQKGMSYIEKRYGAKKFISYFQPYTNTYADVETLRKLYEEAIGDPRVIGIAIGTRPDCVDSDKLDLLEDFAKSRFVLVEYGLQSVYDGTLEYINRGHDFKCFVDAVNLTRGRGIGIGAHIIVGFPTETREEMLKMADEISTLPIEFLKIHQLQIVKDTIMAGMYEEKLFPAFGYEEYLNFVVDFVERLRPDMVLQRLFALSPDDILIAPKWGKTRQQIIRDIDSRFKDRNAWQGRLFNKKLSAVA